MVGVEQGRGKVTVSERGWPVGLDWRLVLRRAVWKVRVKVTLESVAELEVERASRGEW